MRGDDMAENFRISLVYMTAKFTLGPEMSTFIFRTGDVSLDRIVCSILIVLSSKNLNNTVSYMRLYPFI
jgi:hypothetical protein